MSKRKKQDKQQTQLEQLEQNDEKQLNEHKNINKDDSMPYLAQDVIDQFFTDEPQEKNTDKKSKVEMQNNAHQDEKSKEDNIKVSENKPFEPQKVEPNDTQTVQKEKFNIYEYISLIGKTVGKGIAGFFSYVFFIIMLPVGKLWSLLKKFWAWLDRKLFESVRKFRREWAYFKKEVKSVRKNIHQTIKKSPKSIGSVLLYYVKKAFKRHPVMFKSISNIAFPVLAAIVLISTISYWHGVTFALKVEANGQKLGYISDESVYLSAQKLVKEKLDTTSKATDDVLGEPVYTIALVKSNELTDAQTISDRIVENTDSAITPACGIYIDDEFICAIKNEMDAMQLFNGILDDYKTDNENDVVGFVEDVKYVQGLYPDNEETIWDTQKLLKKLKGKKAAAVYYTIKEGDTVSGIAHANGLRTSELFAMNPKVSENIQIDDKLLVSNEVNYLRIKVVKTEVKKEKIPYKTEKKENSKLFKGTKKVKREGSKGTAKITQLVTYVDGVRVGCEEIDRETVKEPVDKIVEVGTKSTSIWGGSSYGSYNVTSSGRLIWPVIGAHRVNSPYGPRNGGFHRGIDLGGRRGYPIVAAASGRVIAAGWGGPYGYRVIIRHGNGMDTLYAHCSTLSVRVGQRVGGGQAIARMGSTGNSTGPHLHFEVRRNGAKVNPAPYIGLRR